MELLRALGVGLLLALPPCAAAEPEPVPARPPAAGVVIERLTPRGAGDRAGLLPGDVILSWSAAAAPPVLPEPARGDVRTPYDLLPPAIEQAPRRTVTLHGKRGAEDKEWVLGPGEWRIETRPGLPEDLATLDLAGRAGAEAGDLAGAGRSWRSAAESARDGGAGRLAAWFLDRLARALAEGGKDPESDAAFEEAVALLERQPDLLAAADLLREWGKITLRRGDRDLAVTRFEKALALDRQRGPDGLSAAVTFDQLGELKGRASAFDDAEAWLRRALAIREELAPGSAEVARSLNRLGVLTRLRGQLSTAEELLTRAEELRRRLSPGDSDHAFILRNLGNLAADRGDFKKAESLHRQSVAIEEEIAPGEAEGGLENLATVAAQRGDLATAEDLLRRVLGPGDGNHNPWHTSRILIKLGHVAFLRGDLEAARDLYRRALEILEPLAPEGREAAILWRSLGEVALLQGDFATARGDLRRAQEIDEKLSPGSIDVAEGLEILARLEIDDGGRLATAETLLRRALAIFEGEAPGSLEVSRVLRRLGEVAVRRGSPREAVALYLRALDLLQKIAPDSSEEAAALHGLGRAKRRAGRTREGVGHLCRAVDVLDGQRARLGGTAEAKISFEAKNSDFYQACLEGLIALGRPAEAFHVLERGRARSFLALLAERDLDLAGLPPELAALRRHANADYDRVQEQLAPLRAGRDDAEIERLTAELRELRTRQEEISARIRRESPHSAALEDPEPLDLAGVRQALDPGTVLLEYAVGEERSWLFVVEPAGARGPGLSVFPVALGAKGLRAEVEAFRQLLKDPGSDAAERQARARRLYVLLVRPAEARLAGAERILVSAAGPLHTLPFAALQRSDRPLLAWKPVHSTLSATVYAELLKARPARQDPEARRLVAFGDPVYPAAAPGSAADPELREAVRRGWSLDPLPSSGREVKAIAALYPEARVYLGREATEERAKSLGSEPQLVHFACHGLLDERLPLNSALALTLPGEIAEGRDNGLLQAWEIFESVRLDADLVTLSACDTALGREAAGEGLVGLTRAFQYAGARSVLATLWGVADVSTARFMEHFYGHLRAGMTKDEALRAAQLDQMQEEGLAHPFHWAAFQLTGDWR